MFFVHFPQLLYFYLYIVGLEIINEDVQKAVREGLLFEYAKHFGKIWAAGNISKNVIHI